MAKHKTNIGGGSGGGPQTFDRMETAEDGFLIRGNAINLLSRPPLPPAVPNPSSINLLATGIIPATPEGTVNIRGNQGVRITTGPPPLPASASDSTNGLEIVASELQNVTIQRGLIPEVDQSIEMTSSGITIDAGVGSLTLKSLTSITLSVADGMSTITLTPAGITIQGILVQIN